MTVVTRVGQALPRTGLREQQRAPLCGATAAHLHVHICTDSRGSRKGHSDCFKQLNSGLATHADPFKQHLSVKQRDKAAKCRKICAWELLAPAAVGTWADPLLLPALPARPRAAPGQPCRPSAHTSGSDPGRAGAGAQGRSQTTGAC